MCKGMGLQDVIEVRQESWFEPLKDVEGQLVGIVSNQPYIPSDKLKLVDMNQDSH
jgi:release factor glutamine methyltransferase